MALAWWRAECERLGLDPADPRLRPPSPPASATDFASEPPLASYPPGADGAARLGIEYVEALPSELRSREGRYYTPRALAQRLVEQAWTLAPRAAEGLVIDPACGAGALLGAAAEQAVADMPPDVALEWAANHLRGRDLDPLAVWLCNLTVAAVLLPAWRELPLSRRPFLPQVASVGDGLADPTPASLVLSNPPFGRVRLSPADRFRFGRALYGHANRATLFLHDAITRLEDTGAAAAFVLPASMVGGAYFQRLRAMLAEEAPPAWLAFVADREGVFPGEVLQESILAVFVRGTGAPRIRCERILINGGVSREALGTTMLPARPLDPWLLPRDPADAELLERARAYSARLADYGWRISTGPLVWNRHRDQLFAEPGQGRLPVIWAQDLRDGRIRPSARRPERWCEARAGQDWLVLDQPAVLVQRTTAPEQQRRLVAALLDEETLGRLGGRVVVENHLNVCTWDGEGPLDHHRLIRFLASSEADRLYRCMTGSVAVSAFELGALPVPGPDELQTDRFPGATG